MPDFLNLKKQNLKYLDALIYLTIRSFHNSSSGLCYPAYETIAKRAGVGRTFVAHSIKRLEASGHFKIIHSSKKHVCNQYIIGDFKRFERVPYEIFDAELTTYEKAMLICLRQFFNDGKLQSTRTIKDFARLLGLTYNTVYNQYTALINKGYLNEVHVISNNSKKSKVRVLLTNKIDWEYDYKKYPKVQTTCILKVA